jgi:hypothetical protein
MLTRGLRVIFVMLPLLASGGLVSLDAAESVSALSVQPVAAKKAPACEGIDRREVRGAQPAYTGRPLTEFRNHTRLCRAIWLPKPRRHLVPQGLAVSGRTAWISGFRHRPGFGQRPCQLVGVNLFTGKRLAFHSAIFGQVGKRPRTYCRHGGGILQRGRWLWMVESSKLWLVDITQRSDVLEARRAWRIEAPVRGSSIVARGDRLGLVPFQTKGAAHIYWFSFKALMKRGVLDLAQKGEGRTQLGAVAATRVPRLVQGATLDPSGRLYLTRSNLACGELITPWGGRVAFIPGAEGLQFSANGTRLWVVSESGARPYEKPSKPFTPAVSSFEWPRLIHGKRTACGFKPS